MRHDGSIVDIVSRKSPLFSKDHHLIGLIGFSIELPTSTIKKILTSREHTIVSLLAEGCTDKQTAKTLDISPRTVEAHINNSKRKLNVNTRAELIALYFK